MNVKPIMLVDFCIRALKANRMRSFLTVLGIVIGVAAVILMLAIGQGTRNQMLDRLSRLGSNRLTVMPGAAGQFVRGSAGDVNTLTLDDSNAIAQLPGVQAVAPSVRANMLSTYQNKTWTTGITGTTPEMMDVSALEIADGRFLNQSDLRAMSTVAVIGQTVYQNLYPAGVSPVGTQIKIQGQAFRVIGLLESVGAAGGMDQDNIIYVPVTTAQTRLLGIVGKTVRSIDVQVVDENQMNDVQASITSLLRKRHRLNANQDDDFNIRNMAQVQNEVQNVTGLMTLFLAGVAAISLVVGGIGVMNIMLVSVTERTREIGIRMAIGASQRDIMNQFLLEAILLSVMGSILGILVGFIGARLFSFFVHWATPISFLSIILAVGFSTLIGVVFGYYPARKAAGLDPAVALSYE